MFSTYTFCYKNQLYMNHEQVSSNKMAPILGTSYLPKKNSFEPPFWANNNNNQPGTHQFLNFNHPLVI